MEALLSLLVIALLFGLGIMLWQLVVARSRADASLLEARQAHQFAQGAQHHAATADQRAAVADQRAAMADQRAAVFSRYQAIVDIEGTVAQMRAYGQATADGIIGAAKALETEARARVAGLEADAARLELSVRALKNITNGYGNTYVLPTAGLLDDLAESFAYTDAGQKLKEARKRSRDMVKAGKAADSDYVEAARRADAILFVIDAFNGKVDTILADTKEDNYGTLSQKVRDAFALVNQNGVAFRRTRIIPEYLEARLDELKWAVVAFELRRRDREEQRALREKMRDEEQAAREAERVVREAEKEENTYRKALEKARRDLEASSESERASFEAKLGELQAKLIAAEEKGKRALSMAQQTKTGTVYVISNVGSFGEHVYKIGMTRRIEPRDRVDELGDASVPFEFDIHALIKTDDAPALENELHKLFHAVRVNRVNLRKEFFKVDLETLRTEVTKRRPEVKWTMAAASREYQETLAMHRAEEAESAAKASGVRRSAPPVGVPMAVSAG